MKQFASRTGIKYVDTNKESIFEQIDKALVTEMYNVEKIMRIEINSDYPLSKFLIIVEEILKDPNFEVKK